MKDGYFTTRELQESRRRARQERIEAQVLAYYDALVATGMLVKRAQARVRKRFGLCPKTIYNYIGRRDARAKEASV